MNEFFLIFSFFFSFFIIEIHHFYVKNKFKIIMFKYSLKISEAMCICELGSFS